MPTFASLLTAALLSSTVGLSILLARIVGRENDARQRAVPISPQLPLVCQLASQCRNLLLDHLGMSTAAYALLSGAHLRQTFQQKVQLLFQRQMLLVLR